MGINTRQSQHYRMLAEEEAARLTIIRALIWPPVPRIGKRQPRRSIGWR
jgi:hypothetical protein